MVQSVTVKVKGLQELGIALQALGVDMAGPIARAVVGAAAKVIREEAKNLVRIRTGKLLQVVGSRRRVKACYVGYEEWIVGVFGSRSGKYVLIPKPKMRENKRGKTVEAMPPSVYWRFLEFGTVNMPAYPFLRPAFEREKGFAAEQMARRLKERIDKAKRNE